jgi:predicted nucleic acid-binding protein
MVRAVIDLNVIISAIISQLGIPHQIWSAWLSEQRLELMISEGMILELADKLATPRIARRYGVRVSHVRSTGARSGPLARSSPSRRTTWPC